MREAQRGSRPAARRAGRRRRLCRPGGRRLASAGARPTWRSRSSTPRRPASGRRTAAPRRSPPPPAACSTSSAAGTRSRREAQPITEMIITDSRTADPVRPVFLTFDGEVAPGEPFAHMVANRVLNGALRRRAAELGIDIIEGVAVQAFETRRRGMTVHLADGVALEHAAAGRRRRRATRGCATWPASRRSTGTTASPASSAPSRMSGRITAAPRSISCRPARSPSCRSRATARRSSGPSARDDAERLVAGDDLVFEDELERRFGLQARRDRASRASRAPGRSA